MKSQRWVPPKNLWVNEKSEVGTPLKTWVDESKRWAQGFKKCQIQMVQNAKNLVHSFYHILYQPKGVPTSRDNFSGTDGTLIYLGNY